MRLVLNTMKPRDLRNGARLYLWEPGAISWSGRQACCVWIGIYKLHAYIDELERWNNA